MQRDVQAALFWKPLGKETQGRWVPQGAACRGDEESGQDEKVRRSYGNQEVAHADGSHADRQDMAAPVPENVYEKTSANAGGPSGKLTDRGENTGLNRHQPQIGVNGCDQHRKTVGVNVFKAVGADEGDC